MCGFIPPYFMEVEVFFHAPCSELNGHCRVFCVQSPSVRFLTFTPQHLLFFCVNFHVFLRRVFAFLCLFCGCGLLVRRQRRHRHHTTPAPFLTAGEAVRPCVLHGLVRNDGGGRSGRGDQRRGTEGHQGAAYPHVHGRAPEEVRTHCQLFFDPPGLPPPKACLDYSTRDLRKGKSLTLPHSGF